ncbi:BIR protein [Plasmodium berghei]|uniref:BIR protein n=1 Tax=Plasmodium berghei TaxID=5821 RepID=A0A113SVG4_PLABE|nr:BIR protein [Plasmodium berghei]
MDEKGMCELFLEADKFFNGKYVILNKINGSSSYKRYCHNKRACLSRDEGIGALSEGLFMKLYTNEKKYSEHFMMWLANKLFKIVKDKDNIKANKMTLSSAYDEYLKNNMGNFKHWNLLYNQRDLKDVNLRYMCELYTLLNYICNTIAYYKKNKEKPLDLRQHSVNCLNQYRNLYKSFSGRDLYLSLLEKLKKIYDDFRTSAIENNTDKRYNIKSRLLELTPINEKDSHFTKHFKTFDSNGPERIPKNKDNAKSVQDKAVKDTTTQNSKNQGGDKSSQNSTPKNTGDNLKDLEVKSQQKQNIQLPKHDEPSLKGDSQSLNLGSKHTGTQKAPSDQTNPSNESETNQGRIDIYQNLKDIHDVFDLSTLKEYGNLIKIYIEEYRESVTNSLDDIRKKLYDNVLPILNDAYSTYADYYKNFDIMEYIKEGLQANERHQTETLEDNPPIKEDGLEYAPPLPDSGTSDAEKKKAQDTQTQMLGDQGNDHLQESFFTQKLGSPNSEQEQISDISSEEQFQSSDDSINIMPRLEIGARTIKADVQKGISEIGFPGNLFKEYKLVVYSVIVIATLVILAVMYKYSSFGWRKKLKKKKNMKKIKKLCNENDTERKLQIH